MHQYRLSIEIFLKKDVLDAQGKTVQQALFGLGFDGIGNLRVGKEIQMDLRAEDRQQAEKTAHEMCSKLLVNEVIENYSVKLEE